MRLLSRVMRTVAASIVFLAAVLVPGMPQAHAATSITGAGSTWSQIAVDQWRADVARQGLTVNYQGVGSTSGRVFYYQDQVDFAVSEIPFQAQVKDTSGNVIYYDEISRAAHRPYAYMPIVAGGTSFMYHLDINGQRVTNLNLTGDAIAKIFTGVITFWDNPEIKATNPTIPLPHLAIRPVIRSDGSGTSAQFTAYMASQTPAVWNAFCAKVGIHLNPCPSTSLYPPFDGSVAQQYSDGVSGYVASSYANGAITYVEYGYATQHGFPVASLQNKAGYFAQPVAAAVSLALKAATFNPDGTQNLVTVYNNPDKRVYPLSSYSYMIVPTTTAKPFTTDKGATLGQFILYFVCVGQQKAEALGYAPLPPNLVQNAFNVEQRIPGAPKPPPLSQCHNPTIDGTYAPPPSASVPPPSPGAAAGGGGTATGGSGGTATGGGGGAATGTAAAGGGNTTTKGGKAAKAAADAAAQANIAAQDPSGELVSNLASVTLPKTKAPVPLLFYVAAGLAALLAVFGPAVLALWLRRGATRT
jgi:phosphate transport system substrate-binding protein